MNQTTLTGKASIDKPWLKYYPTELLDNLQIPFCTMNQYLQYNMPGMDVPAIHYYGTDITWAEVFENTEKIARSLKVLGCKEGDQVPSFLRSVPEFISLFLAAERVGASILCRMNSLKENMEAVASAGSHFMFAHDFLTVEEMNTFLSGTSVEKIILLPPCNSCDIEAMPDYVRNSLNENYTGECAHGPAIMTWDEFLALGENFTGEVDAPFNPDRPLFRCYTSGSTGPSKQVIHSAHSLIGVLGQMNFYGGREGIRPTWMVTTLPPTLVAVVTSMMLLPLASNKLLIQNPWVAPDDIDLELMRLKPNNWPLIPMFMECLLLSKRIPADYDLSHLFTAGAGAEACNNAQLRAFRKFMDEHNCHIPFTTGYGSSEAGSNLTFHISGRPVGNYHVGCPMPLTTVAIFKPGTTEEVGYNEFGEICVNGPGVMLGYNLPENTAKALITHPDGKVWLHMGDIGAMDEDGNIRNAGRGTNRRFGGGFLDFLIMENLVADAEIPGVRDQFFVNVPDQEHEGYFLPYLYVVLEEGHSIEEIHSAVHEALEPHMYPVEIRQVARRPYWQFKTNRFGLVREILAEKQN